MGEIFLKLVKRNFIIENSLHKIFNKNTSKIGYSCMGNVPSVLSAHNRNIWHQKKSELGCSCTSKTDFPIYNKCLTPKIVYQADVRNDTNDEKNFFLGVSETPLKETPGHWWLLWYRKTNAKELKFRKICRKSKRSYQTPPSLIRPQKKSSLCKTTGSQSAISPRMNPPQVLKLKDTFQWLFPNIKLYWSLFENAPQ